MLQFFISITLLLFISACSFNTPTPSSVTWYKDRNITSQNKNAFIGYGDAPSLKEAKALAKEEIAYSLMSKVQSSTKINSSETKNSDFSDYSNTSKTALQVSSNINLDSLKTLKYEYKNSRYYVVLEYINLDLEHKMKKEIQNPTCSTKNSTNSYISQTLLYKKIAITFGCPLDIALHRRNEVWYLQYKSHLFLLNETELEDLFVSHTNKNFTFKASAKELVDGDVFHFNVQSSKSGYITLLVVYENGVTTLLQESRLLNTKMRIPSLDDENNYIAGLIDENRDTYDLYVALFTEKKLDVSRFTYADDTLQKNEKAYKFDELIQMLDHTEFATILLRTKSK